MSNQTALSTDSQLAEGIRDFVERCRLDPDESRFSSTIGGSETLYASCYAAMISYYLGDLDELPESSRQAWANYINSWQDRDSGLFIGPELAEGELISQKHSFEHLAHHLTAHVLSALDVLGAKPAAELKFAHTFLDVEVLRQWLQDRDWREAWLEGNNLIFVGQFLIYLRQVEHKDEAEAAVQLLMDWLESELDPATGLWGTNGYCSVPAALYGGYHQLLLFYHEGRPLRFGRNLVDVALSLQNEDGSFDPHGRGSACQDTDAIDILVNLYKMMDYRRPEIRLAIRRSLPHVLDMRVDDGGFVNRSNERFVHMGIASTESGAGESNMFTTWFRLHSLALIQEILGEESVPLDRLRFNPYLSMGWHKPAMPDGPGLAERVEELAINFKKTLGKLRVRLAA